MSGVRTLLIRNKQKHPSDHSPRVNLALQGQKREVHRAGPTAGLGAELELSALCGDSQFDSYKPHISFTKFWNCRSKTNMWRIPLASLKNPKGDMYSKLQHQSPDSLMMLNLSSAHNETHYTHSVPWHEKYQNQGEQPHCESESFWTLLAFELRFGWKPVIHTGSFSGSGLCLPCYSNDRSALCLKHKIQDTLSTSSADLKIRVEWVLHNTIPFVEQFLKCIY